MSFAMEKKRGAAVSDPHGEVEGSRSVTSIANCGWSAGANPMKDAIVLFSS